MNESGKSPDGGVPGTSRLERSSLRGDAARVLRGASRSRRACAGQPLGKFGQLACQLANCLGNQQTDTVAFLCGPPPFLNADNRDSVNLGEWARPAILPTPRTFICRRPTLGDVKVPHLRPCLPHPSLLRRRAQVGTRPVVSVPLDTIMLMAVEKREQVFISSTFRDLVDERRAVIQTLLEADCIPAGMELFPASEDEKFDLIKRVIDLCDYYVVIVGGRYGSVDVQEQLSYTEMEFDYAVKTKKPVLGFLHGNPGKLPGEKLDLNAGHRKKLDAFRAKIEQKMVKYWHEPSDLPGQVALAIMQVRKSHPAEGWIRASQAMTPEVKAELAELRARVRELTAELDADKQHRRSVIDPSELVQGEEEAPISCYLDFHWQDTIDSGKAYTSNRARALWTTRPTWNGVFKHLGPELMDEAAEERMMESLSALCLTLSRKDLLKAEDKETEQEEESTQNDAEEEQVGIIYEAEITVDSFNDVKVHLNALGLIEKGNKRRPASDTNTYWKLTDRGHDQLLMLRAKRRPTLTEIDKARGNGELERETSGAQPS